MPMNAYLTLGMTPSGDIMGISSQRSGKTKLICPFCRVELIAVKGAIYQHHFRHDGETCKESLTNLPDIPGWDHFHLSVPEHLVTELQAHAEKNGTSSYWGAKSQELARHELISRDPFSGHWVLSESALVITGQLSLSKFSRWFRLMLKQRIESKQKEVMAGHIHPAHLDIEAWRQQQILTSTLYLMRLEVGENLVIHKIGRTGRAPEQRLSEVISDMKSHHNQPVSGAVVKAIGNAGYVEKYALWKHKKSMYAAGSHQEYLALEPGLVRQLKSELTRFENARQPFDLAERFIASGRWRYESKRIESVRNGIAKTISAGGKFGRPVGTKKTGSQEWLSQHSDIISCINQGLSLSVTAQRTGKSISTVKRVKCHFSAGG